MGRYVDGFVLVVPTKKLSQYRRLAELGAKVWKKCGALEYYECVGDDLQSPCGTPFTSLTQAKRGETVVFSWIVYKSRAHRDKVNALVMQDPRMNDPKLKKSMPFDMRRMSWGGFKALVSW